MEKVMSEKQEQLYENQTKTKDGRYISKFLFIHDDHFCRAKSKHDLLEFLNNYKYENEYTIAIHILSYDDNKNVNVFLASIIADIPLESLDSTDICDGDYSNFRHDLYQFEALDSIYYYEMIATNYNGIALDEIVFKTLKN